MAGDSISENCCCHPWERLRSFSVTRPDMPDASERIDLKTSAIDVIPMSWEEIVATPAPLTVAYRRSVEFIVAIIYKY